MARTGSAGTAPTSRNPPLGHWPAATKETAEQTFSVWYSPWQHQNEDNPLVPLIREIQNQFTAWLKLRQTAKDFNRQAGLASAKLLEHLADAALSLTAGRTVKVARGLTDAMRSGWKEAEDGLTALSDGQRFHLLFEDAIQQVLKARSENGEIRDSARLVIFIDDLDRCEGEVIVRLLEIIKLYLGTRRCVFVLGLDDAAVLDAFKQHRNPSEEGNREYLEKLFQATLAVPLPSQQGVREGIERQLRLHGIPRPVSGDSERQAGTDQAIADLAEDIEALLEPNPRKIKNFVNSLCAAWAMHGCSEWIGAGTDSDYWAEASRFVLLQYLRQFHRPVWRLLERQPETIRQLYAVLQGETTGTEPDGNEALLTDAGLLREIFFRAFSHVLKTPDADDKTKHGNETLESAVQSAIERRDRKRSDDTFRQLFCALFEQDCAIHPRHLFLVADDERKPDRQTQPPAEPSGSSSSTDDTPGEPPPTTGRNPDADPKP
jgi:hypothetical protein